MRKIKICESCHLTFDRPKKGKTGFRVSWVEYASMRFCSIQCRSVYWSKKYRGGNNPNYKGGTTINRRSYFPCNSCKEFVSRKNSRCRKCWHKLLKESPENHPRFGKLREKVGYKHLHKWMNTTFGKPIDCEHCGENKATDWANKTGTYIRKRSDWFRLCRKCHSRYDWGHHLIGKAKKFKQIKSN